MLLRFDVDYVRDFNGLPEGTLFELLFSNVISARALRFQQWPGGCEIHAGMPREEQTRLVEEYQAKWREESQDWQILESSINEESPEVSNATLATGEDRVALRIGLLMDDGSYRDAFVRAEKLDVRTTGGKLLSPKEFVALGEAYWNDFGKK
jgi:hypothetical protein